MYKCAGDILDKVVAKCGSWVSVEELQQRTLRTVATSDCYVCTTAFNVLSLYGWARSSVSCHAPIITPNV